MAETQGGTVLLDPLEVLTQHAGSSVGAAIAAFSVLAIATSFIGTTLGKSHPRRLSPTSQRLLQACMPYH